VFKALGDVTMTQFLAQFVYLVCPEKQKIAMVRAYSR
jgi:hypothetical protein